MNWNERYPPFSFLLGKTITKIDQGDDEIFITLADDTQLVLCHVQNCCESVYIEDVAGDLNDLLNTPITLAEESFSNENPLDPKDDSFTWTFYRLATVKGYVNIRFYGTSNGYYGESATLIRVK